MYLCIQTRKKYKPLLKEKHEQDQKIFMLFWVWNSRNDQRWLLCSVKKVKAPGVKVEEIQRKGQRERERKGKAEFHGGN